MELDKINSLIVTNYDYFYLFVKESIIQIVKIMQKIY